MVKFHSGPIAHSTNNFCLGQSQAPIKKEMQRLLTSHTTTSVIMISLLLCTKLMAVSIISEALDYYSSIHDQCLRMQFLNVDIT